jgi:hypothetical protein
MKSYEIHELWHFPAMAAHKQFLFVQGTGSCTQRQQLGPCMDVFPRARTSPSPPRSCSLSRPQAAAASGTAATKN